MADLLSPTPDAERVVAQSAVQLGVALIADWATVTDYQILAGDAGLLDRLAIWVVYAQRRGYEVIQWRDAATLTWHFEAIDWTSWQSRYEAEKARLEELAERWA